MKTTFIVLATLCLIFFACENATNPLEPTTNLQPAMAKPIDSEGPSLARAAKVDVCHLNGDGEYITINISENAFQAHLDHGDKYTFSAKGTYVLHYTIGSVNNPHKFVFTDVDENGDFTGMGYWPLPEPIGGYIYNYVMVGHMDAVGNFEVNTFEPGHPTWTLVGTVDECGGIVSLESPWSITPWVF